jgi:hypothetical protein
MRTMQQLTEDEIRRIFGEVFMDELKVIREYLEDLLPVKADVAILKKDVAEIKSDMKVVKALLKDHSGQLNNHETRTVRLESARAT